MTKAPVVATARAALYLRVSTGRQADSDLSIPDQRRQIEGYCLSRGWEVAAEFVDPATGELVGRVTAGESGEITESAQQPDAETEALAEAVEAASESAMYDFGAD